MPRTLTHAEALLRVGNSYSESNLSGITMKHVSDINSVGWLRYRKFGKHWSKG